MVIAAEAAYIVEDSGASVLVASAAQADVVERTAGGGAAPAGRVAVGGDLPGFEPYEDLLAAQPATRPPGEREGGWMLDSSGTTGKPKGVKPTRIGGPLGAPSACG